MHNIGAVAVWPMIKRHFIGVALFLLLFSPAFAAEAPKRNITEKDLFDFVWIGDPQMSPDGSQVAFVRVTTDEKKLGYKTAIWLAPTAPNEQARQLTNGPHDSSPRWSPDGKRLAFTRASDKDGKTQPGQLGMLAMSGGDAFTFTDLPKGAGSPAWSPDGKWIVFTSTSNPEDLAKQKKKEEGAAEEEHHSDVHVVTRAVYQSDDDGYLDASRPQHLWLIAAPQSAADKAQPKQLTTGRFDEETAAWSQDGAQIYFTSLRVDEPYYELPKTELYRMPSQGGAAQKLTTIKMNTGPLRISPDGKQAAFIAAADEPVNSYTQPDLWTIDLTPNAQPKNLTGQFDYDVGSSVFGDNSAPRGFGSQAPIWSADGKSIIEMYAQEGETNLAWFDAATGAKTDLTQGKQAIVHFSASRDGAKVVGLVSTPTRLNDLFLIEGHGAAPRQLTDSNRDLFAKLNLTEPEEISYTSFDGKKIQAWVQKPPGFNAAKKYPLILDIHGGPHAAYGFIFEHEFQWMAAKGYVVLYPNPRGSTSYGQDFGNIIQYKYPGDDYKDLMAGVDELIKRGYIDEKKMGVTGGSGGGLLTDWVVGQTTRFAAAVAQRDIASWADWWYTADFTLFQPTWFKAPPFLDKADFEARSPITYINKVQTPLMLILGEKDTRTPPTAGGEQMFRALKFRKVPTVMVKFPDETHELSRSGQPWHRIERLEHIVGWFDHWLMGVAKPEYEIGKGNAVPVKSENAPGKAKPPGR